MPRSERKWFHIKWDPPYNAVNFDSWEIVEHYLEGCETAIAEFRMARDAANREAAAAAAAAQVRGAARRARRHRRHERARAAAAAAVSSSGRTSESGERGASRGRLAPRAA